VLQVRVITLGPSDWVNNFPSSLRCDLHVQLYHAFDCTFAPSSNCLPHQQTHQLVKVLRVDVGSLVHPENREDILMVKL
jgi:hypothetical protein